jgi:hypothetical protein
MHNLHIARVKADCPEEACDSVDGAIMDWGGENNWRTIEGCIDINDVVHKVTDEIAFIDQFKSLDDIKKILIDTIKHDAERGKRFLNDCINGNISSAYDWIGAKNYCELMYNVSKLDDGIDSLHIFEDELFPWRLDEVGITNMEDYSIGENFYFVVINMHS